MRITRVEAWREAVDLTRPYTIARGTISAVELFFVEIATDGGVVGLGSASPAPGVTGETPEACGAALERERLAWLRGRDPRQLGELCRAAGERMAETPAARAAVDMALHDLLGRALEVPVADLLGRRRAPLPTSVTIGIQPLEETLADAEDFIAQGFRCLKVKIGHAFEEDVERLRALRRRWGSAVTIRIDANQGYDLAETRRLLALIDELDLELVEQPLPASDDASLQELPAASRRRLAADESLHGPRDAFELARAAACGIFNIKLMKCGGISPALAIATVAEAAGVELMWGCMDESAISIAAALHAAYACPQTRYLDLDGSLELARDPARGGFRILDGRLELLGEPGLGVSLERRALAG